MHPLQVQEIVIAHKCVSRRGCYCVAVVMPFPKTFSPAEAAVDHWPFSHLSASATFFLLSVIPSSILTGKVLLVFLFAYFVASGFLITHENK